MITPYLVFNGNCQEALEFYQKTFESKIGMSMPYGEYVPDDLEMLPPDLSSWVLNAEMQICGTNFWFADEVGVSTNGNAVRLTATVTTKEEAQIIFDGLKENGEITLPPTETFYSTFHAAVTDKYSIAWNIVAVEAPNHK